MAKLALLGGRKTVTARPASPTWPRFSSKAIGAVAKLLASGRGISLGRSRIVLEAEGKFAAFHGARYAMAVNTGTASLHCAVAGCNIAPGDEVITSPYSWGSTTGCILHQGAIPVFADVLEETGLIDPASVERRITARTRGMVVVHIYGQPCDMTALRRIARRHKLALIEDASQAHGAMYRGRPVGSWGDAAGFSCMGGKLLAATEMGMFLTSDRSVYDRALLIAQHPCRLTLKPSAHGGGLRRAYHKYIDSLSFNYRTSDVTCTLLLDQLAHLRRWNRNRAANRKLLVEKVGELGFVRFPAYPAHVQPSYHMVTLRYDQGKAGGVTRETFAAAMSAEGAGLFTYVRIPIPTWTRMQADSYRGPANPWIAALKRARTRYESSEIPVCMKLARSSSLQMVFNNYTELEERLMNQFAAAFHKVAENLPALLDWQRRAQSKARK